MSSFSIDDVRETFTSDVSSFLGKIEDNAQLLLGAPAMGPPGTQLPDGRYTFEAIADLGHAIGGTAALVQANSLADVAARLEELACGGQEALVELERCAARARRAAQLCLEGALRMRAMLELELADRSGEALSESRQWIASVKGESGAMETAAPLSAPAEAALDAEPPAFNFSVATDVLAPALDDVDAPSHFAFEAYPPAPSIGAELRQVFDEEAREALGALQRELGALVSSPGDAGTMGSLERLYHTLKGAAATVGLTAVSELAAGLQRRMELMLEDSAPVTAELHAELVAETNEMLRIAQLPAIELGAEAASSAPAVEQAHGFFVEEAGVVLGEIEAALPALSGDDTESADRGRGELRRLFHLLKGSALIVGESAIGEEAERIQGLLEGAASTAESLSPAIEGALALIRQRLASAAATTSEAKRTEPPAAPVRQPVQLAVNPELWETFLQECRDLMETIDKELLALEESDQPKQSLEALMRHCHTLKGVLNTVGLTPSGEMLHKVEDLLEALMQAAILPPMRTVATLLLGVQDEIRKHLKQAKEGFVDSDLGRLQARIARLLGRPKTPGEEATGVSLTGVTAAGGTEAGASIHSIYSARSLRTPRSKDGHDRSPASGDEALERRYIRVATERLDALMNLAGELVVSRSRLLTRVAALRALQQDLGSGNHRLLETVETFREEHEFANLDGRRRRRAAVAEGRKSERPGFEHFGELELDRYEDIHILSRRLAEITGDFSEMSVLLSRNLAAFNDDSDVFGRIVSGIQSEVTRARMVPLEQLFTRLRLPVRDAAARENKEVRVAVEGADVHIDKTIADALLQPMLHLVRNAAVHGVEAPGARERAGKPAVGTVTLLARQESGQIVVEVADDGAGLDLERLRARGVAMGLVAAETPLSDPSIRDLVFAPGLSTRAQAGAVSGRGVGCDVVRRTVERMNGTIRVESTPGRGTRFIVTLPVTLAITKALIVRQGDRKYAIPLHFAERIIDAEEEAIIHSAGIHRIKVDGTFLTVKRLEQYFGADGEAAVNGAVLMLRVGTARTALQVDAVVGQEEVVVKSLGNLLNGHPLFAGVTIRGSGELVLIVDVPGLLAERGQRAEGKRYDQRQDPERALGAAEPTGAAGIDLEQAGEREAAAAEVAPGRLPIVTPPAARNEGPLRVLFVDDSLSVRKFAQITLAGLGADVTLAVDGLDAMAKLREGSFDLVFTDLEMPRMHGFELIRELRFLPAYQDLPIIVVTSRSGHKHQQQARALGATEYLTKPFSAQSLDGVLKRFGRRELPPADQTGNQREPLV